MEGGDSSNRQLMKFYTSDTTHTPCILPRGPSAFQPQEGIAITISSWGLLFTFASKVHIALWTTSCAKPLWFNSSWINHYKSWQCAYRYLNNMFKYFLDEEPVLFKEVKISRIEWHTWNIRGGGESKWDWCPLRFFVWLFVGLAFLRINILISAQLTFPYTKASWKKRFLDRQVIIFLLPHFKAHSNWFASPFLCPSYWTRII